MAIRKLRILLVSAEVAPFAKVGGLADVAGALPKALRSLGHDVRVAMPAYRMVEDNPAYGVQDLLPSFPVAILPNWTEEAYVRQTRIGDDVPVYLIGGGGYFADATESRKVYIYAPDPYIFFAKAVCEFVPRLSPTWTPDIIHANDWHTGLIPAYLDSFYRDHATWGGTARIFTIHNLAYQGDFDHEVFRRTGLPDHLFHFEKLEFYGRMNFMKGGLVFSHMVNTVSPTYAREVQTDEYGCRLEGLLRHLAYHDRLSGILNGIDYQEYDPAADTRIAAAFNASDPSGKSACKRALQVECGLSPEPSMPVIGVVSRLADQKGFDLIRSIADEMLAMPAQFVLLGTGDPYYERFFSELENRNPGRVRAVIGFDAGMAQRIYAGSDMFLMPSRFEPCGLGQMMSLRYGTIPIVRSTGGLADTINDYSTNPRKGNGFAFTEYDAGALLDTVRRAVAIHALPAKWQALVQRALKSDFSWNISARQYAALYRMAQEKARSTTSA